MRIQDVAAMQSEPLRSQLAQLFRHFPPDAEVTLRQYKSGTCLFREGAPNTLVYMILSGYLTTSWEQPGPCQYILMQNKPLTFVGDLAALAGFCTYTTSVHVKKASTLLSIPTDVFLDWLYRDLPAYRSLVQFNLNLLLTQDRFNRSAVGQSSYHRILDFLRWHYAVQEKYQEPPVKLHLTRENMVEEIGDISLRSLNRYLARIRQEGLISIQKGKVQITREQYQKMTELLKP